MYNWSTRTIVCVYRSKNEHIWCWFGELTCIVWDWCTSWIEATVSNKNVCPFHQSIDFTHQRSITRTGVFGAFSILDPGKFPSSQEEMVSQKYGQARVDILMDEEMELLLTVWASMAEVLKLLTTDITLCLTYPNLVKLAKVCLTLPVSTADYERAFLPCVE